MNASSHLIDPVDVSPIVPLQDSYTYHSTPYESPEGEGWIMGIDEAGRGRKSSAIVMGMH
jgi:ribonuclease H2 subunit A